jgi:hypothetical protein
MSFAAHGIALMQSECDRWRDIRGWPDLKLQVDSEFGCGKRLLRMRPEKID